MKIFATITGIVIGIIFAFFGYFLLGIPIALAFAQIIGSDLSFIIAVIISFIIGFRWAYDNAEKIEEERKIRRYKVQKIVK